MKLALIGYGKMGKAVEAAAIEAGHEIVLRQSVQDENLSDALYASGAEAAIEFTRPEAAFDNVIACLNAGVPIVCGTTGWLSKWPEVKLRCRETNGAVLYASNFSIGVFLFTELNRILGHWMQTQPQYAVSISETHHIHKKDAPSGTAITLAEAVLEGLTRKNGWVHGISDDDTKIEIASIRTDEVPGTHSIQFNSVQDTITLTHEAHSRAGFALGAIRAAEWIQGKKGLFGMRDMVLPPKL